MKAISVLALLWLTTPLMADERSETIRLAKKYGAVKNGKLQVDVVMPDGTRCDLVSDTYAIEVDYAPKWPQSIGQATLYSIWTRRTAAVLILSRGEVDKLHLLRCRMVCDRLRIRMFVERVKP